MVFFILYGIAQLLLVLEALLVFGEGIKSVKPTLEVQQKGKLNTTQDLVMLLIFASPQQNMHNEEKKQLCRLSTI